MVVATERLSPLPSRKQQDWSGIPTDPAAACPSHEDAASHSERKEPNPNRQGSGTQAATRRSNTPGEHSSVHRGLVCGEAAGSGGSPAPLADPPHRSCTPPNNTRPKSVSEARLDPQHYELQAGAQHRLSEHQQAGRWTPPAAGGPSYGSWGTSSESYESYESLWWQRNSLIKSPCLVARAVSKNVQDSMEQFELSGESIGRGAESFTRGARQAR